MKTFDELLELEYRISLRMEDGDYVAAIDELPGCIAHGRTPNKAVESLREAKRAWMSSRMAAGLEIPEPRDTSEYSGRVLLRMPKSLHRNLSLEAAAEGISLNQHIVSALSMAWGKSSEAECNRTTMMTAFVRNLNSYRDANFWSSFETPSRHGGQTIALGANQLLLTPGISTLTGSDFAFSSQDAPIGTSPEDIGQRRPRRIQCA